MAAETADRFNTDEVAPGISLKFTPPFVLICHWYELMVPLAVTLNDAEVPSHTTVLEGLEATDAAVFTVNKAAFELMLAGQVLLTTQRY